MTRPDMWDDSPAATEYRRRELAAEVTAWNAAHPLKVARKAAASVNKARRTRELKARIEALRDEADRLEATLPHRIGRAENIGHAASEWDKLRPYCDGDELAQALGYTSEATLLLALRRADKRAAA